MCEWEGGKEGVRGGEGEAVVSEESPDKLFCSGWADLKKADNTLRHLPDIVGLDPGTPYTQNLPAYADVIKL